MAKHANFRIVGTVSNRDAVREAIERGDAAAAIVIPPDFASDLKRGQSAQAQVIVDAADPLSSQAAIGAATLAGVRSGPELSSRPTPTLSPPVDIRVRPWYNPEGQNSRYIVPGIIGILLTMTMVSITGAAIVRERERGTLEQLVVTPIGKTSLMLGKTIPFAVVGYAVTGPVLGGCVRRPVRTGACSTSTLLHLARRDVLFSRRCKEQVQAMQGAYLHHAECLLSGFVPALGDAGAAQWSQRASLTTSDIMRGVLPQGVQFDEVWRRRVWWLRPSVSE